MSYEYPHYKLHNDPLSLVLCQIRFSKVRRMPELMDTIYEQLRKEGFSEDVSGVMQQVLVTATGKPEISSKKWDEFRTKDNQWSLSIAEDSIALVTTGYDRFTGFAEQLQRCLEIINSVACLSQGQIHRIGLRYVDVIQPQDGETFRDYLQPSLHGPISSVFSGEMQFLHLESVGQTKNGTLFVRITQNNQSVLVPPDIILKPMSHVLKVDPDKLITLVDTDHFVEGSWDFDLEKIISTADTLHQGINAAWFNDFITEKALKVWRSEDVK